MTKTAELSAEAVAKLVRKLEEGHLSWQVMCDGWQEKWLAMGFSDSAITAMRATVDGEAADTITSLSTHLSEKEAELAEAKEEVLSLGEFVASYNRDEELQNLMRLNNELLARANSSEAEVEKLKAALEPFGTYFNEARFDLDNNGDPLPDEQGMGWVYLTVGDFRRARQALGGGHE